MFDREPVELTHHTLDVVGRLGEYLHYSIQNEWRGNCLRLGRRAYECCEVMAYSASFYFPSKELPPRIDESLLNGIFETPEEARCEAEAARRCLLDQLGFIAWFASVTWEWRPHGLTAEMTQFISDLRLGERPKRGCIVSLHKDWKYLNIGHFIKYHIPFHYAWTATEENDNRFFMYSRPFLTEYCNEVEGRDGAPVPLEELPSYYLWRPKLVNYDMFLQDQLMRDRRNWRRPHFLSTHIYSLILHDFWGARKLSSRMEIRACAELYNAITEYSQGKTYVTFFAQYPLKRTSRRRAWEVGMPGEIDPQHSAQLKRRRSESRYVPLAERIQSPEPTGISLYGAEPSIRALREIGYDDTWQRQYRPMTSRRRSSRSMSPKRRADREQTLERRISSRFASPAADSYRRSVSADSFRSARTKTGYLAALMDWATIVTEDNPHSELPDNMVWNPLMLKKGILVFDDPRAQIRMRAWPTIFKNHNKIEDLLNLAIRFGIPFSIYFRMRDIPLFHSKVSDTQRSALAGTLEPGYIDTQLVWTGGASTRTKYFDLVSILLSRPYAGAFVAMGGLANRIARWRDKNLPRRYASGPSSRVTEYNRGFMLRAKVQSNVDGSAEDLTRDQVSEEEINVLFGYINKGHPNSDVTLFPPQWLCEKECPGHFHGTMSTAAQAIFDDICRRIETPAIDDCWKNKGQWRSYLRSAYRKEHAPKDWPKEEDFARGSELLRNAFGGTWNLKKLNDIIVPEPFLESVHGNYPDGYEA
ncbi:hypothetical protein FB451DRAFT_1039242 [Mycena latifolia]|nr:hypothetical protein FB451DRAFT_1039242 [Mycena latifolia]